jgi:DNA gyrase subunit A
LEFLGDVPPNFIPPEDEDERLVSIELDKELKDAFLSYAMSTILGRALPDARDGLKPVHRRVLYAMHALGLTPESGYRKCARVVGEVLGKFHPHGDQSVYDALVRMAQDFVMQHPLINGHGNFGSIDADPPAAMRYTEAKLSKLGSDALLSDIKEDSVPFAPNFDGNEDEPLVLPARVPMLLLNGGSGIAVGMATNIPPHNLGELCDALVAMIDDPEVSLEDLIKIMPGPDFPTSGYIMGHTGIENLYRDGKGSILMRAKAHIEQVPPVKGGRQRSAIVVTELPYMTNKANLLVKIAELVNDKKIDGIRDLRDESDRDGIRVVIELKADCVPAVVKNNLFKKTALQTTFSGNMLALVNDGTQPARIGLIKALQVFITFRFGVIRRRTKFQLDKLVTRDHIVQGLLIALSRIDDVIEIVRNSKDSTSAKAILSSDEYGLSDEQIEAILALRLGRLTSMEENKLKKEHDDLEGQITTLSGVMSDETKVYKIMKSETKQLKKAHAVPRRTLLLDEEGELSDQDLLANDRSIIILTKSGYIKRIPIEEFEAQSRGGKGKASTRLADDSDSIQHFFTCNDHDSVLLVTGQGIAYSVKAFQIPLSSRTAKGAPLPQVLPISSEEKVSTVIPIDQFNENEFLILLTSKGYIKKTPLNAFSKITQRGLIIISLGEGDTLDWARRCDADAEILVATRDGFASRYSVSQLKATSRTSRGVKALKLRPEDKMADMDILADDSAGKGSHALVVSSKGYGKRISIDEFRNQKRGGKGVIAIKFKEKAGGSRKAGGDKPDTLACMVTCKPGDEVVLSTSRGTVIRQRVDDLSIQSRTATGVLIQRLAKDDVITSVDVLPPEKIT